MVSDTIWVAIIGAVATVVAALIAVYARGEFNPHEGLSARRRKRKKTETTVSIVPTSPPPMPAPTRFTTKEIKPLEKLRGWIASEHPLSRYWPTGLSNVEVRFIVEGLAIGVRCDDKTVGYFRVIGVDADLQEVLYLEGSNNQDTDPEVGLNRLELPDELLHALFHAARNKREHKRTGDIAYLKGFEDFLRRAEEIIRRKSV